MTRIFTFLIAGISAGVVDFQTTEQTADSITVEWSYTDGTAVDVELRASNVLTGDELAAVSFLAFEDTTSHTFTGLDGAAEYLVKIVELDENSAAIDGSEKSATARTAGFFTRLEQKYASGFQVAVFFELDGACAYRITIKLPDDCAATNLYMHLGHHQLHTADRITYDTLITSKHLLNNPTKRISFHADGLACDFSEKTMDDVTVTIQEAAFEIKDSDAVDVTPPSPYTDKARFPGFVSQVYSVQIDTTMNLYCPPVVEVTSSCDIVAANEFIRQADNQNEDPDAPASVHVFKMENSYQTAAWLTFKWEESCEPTLSGKIQYASMKEEFEIPIEEPEEDGEETR